MKRQSAKGGNAGSGKHRTSAQKPLRPAKRRGRPPGSASGSGTLSGGQKKAAGSGSLHPAQHKAAASRKLAAPKKGRVSAVRKWSPGWDVACCSAQALGTLLGWDYEDVLALYWRTTSDPDAGASITATLEAAEAPARAVSFIAMRGSVPRARAALILGVTLPEPHAVAVTPDGTWWSWGEPFDPAGWPELIIDEAWAVNLHA